MVDLEALSCSTSNEDVHYLIFTLRFSTLDSKKSMHICDFSIIVISICFCFCFAIKTLFFSHIDYTNIIGVIKLFFFSK